MKSETSSCCAVVESEHKKRLSGQADLEEQARVGSSKELKQDKREKRVCLSGKTVHMACFCNFSKYVLIPIGAVKRKHPRI